jgi:DNA polymerase III sliding clamp (beta) subunit (PCNA family)
MDTCLMQKQAAVKNKSMSPVLRQHLIHAKGEEMVHMQTTAPTAKITTGIYI